MKTFLKSILAVTLFITAGSVFAQNSDFGPGDQGPRHDRGTPGMQGIEHLHRALHRLDLSDEQKTSIEGVMQRLKTEMQPILEDTRTNQDQLRNLVKADSFDQDAVAGIAQSEGQLATQRIMLTSQAMSEVFSFLSDEQRTQLDEMVAQQKNKRNTRRHAKHRRHAIEG